MAWESRYGGVRGWVYRAYIIVNQVEQQVVIPESHESLVDSMQEWLNKHAYVCRPEVSVWSITAKNFLEFKLKYSDWFVNAI